MILEAHFIADLDRFPVQQKGPEDTHADQLHQLGVIDERRPPSPGRVSSVPSTSLVPSALGNRRRQE
jgi:hypothetical protein